MARTSSELTQNEINNFQNFVQRQNLHNTEQVGQLFADIIVTQWDMDITEHTMTEAFKYLVVTNPEIVKSKAQAAYDNVAAENPAAAQTLEGFYPSTLSQDPNEKFSNLVELLAELHGHVINAGSVHAAIGRNSAPVGKFSTRNRRPLHFAPSTRHVDPRQHTDTSEKIPVNEPLWRKLKREREAREAQNTPAQTQHKPQDAFDIENQELLSNGTHSQQAAMAEEFKRAVTAGLSSRLTNMRLKEVQRAYKGLVDRGRY